MSGFDPRAAVAAQPVTSEKTYTVAPGLSWRTTTGVGKSALTVESAGEGKPDRVHLTYAPVGPGRVQRTPLGAVFSALDAGDLDGAACVWLTRELDDDGTPSTEFVSADGVEYVTVAQRDADVAAGLKAERAAVAKAAKEAQKS